MSTHNPSNAQACQTRLEDTSCFFARATASVGARLLSLRSLRMGKCNKEENKCPPWPSWNAVWAPPCQRSAIRHEPCNRSVQLCRLNVKNMQAAQPAVGHLSVCSPSPEKNVSCEIKRQSEARALFCLCKSAICALRSRASSVERSNLPSVSCVKHKNTTLDGDERAWSFAVISAILAEYS